MGILYIASIGCTAAKHIKAYWRRADEYFKFSEAIAICGENLAEEVTGMLEPNCNLIIIKKPFYGADHYLESVKAILDQVHYLMDWYAKRGVPIDEIVVNSSGGTEKMSCIIKDALDVLDKEYPGQVTHYWGCASGYEVIYTRKPRIIPEDFMRSRPNG